MLIVLTITSRSETQSKNTNSHHIVRACRPLRNGMCFLTSSNFDLPYDTVMMTAQTFISFCDLRRIS